MSKANVKVYSNCVKIQVSTCEYVSICLDCSIIKTNTMTPRFYILNEEVRKEVAPEAEELKNALSQMKWGMKKGIVSLVNPIRTSTTYWEV